ncbi:hypothetical protein SAMN06295912_102245 [Sphingomonas laterariae]|uniref:Uncharacterized protein n=1 Tax=Edaphosphingomonas laterariae TaxID=861865 RepID=A0A239CJY2_9SPHN|nr:hypothetical protein [Sphingomonas laterariae]SNS20249.1 hypothetical protein SAMN06295912_102245 [Sphingomonas laterariae]
MIKLVRSAWALLTGSRETVILILLAAVAAGLYATWATTRADRDRLAAWANTACLAAGSSFDAAAEGGGVPCTRRIAELARIDRESQAASNRLLADAAATRATKIADDRTLAANQTGARLDAARQMEKADEEVPADDRVAGDWFDALNGLGGLRPPGR